MKKSETWSRLFLLGFLAASLTLAGCSGDDGSNGAAGAQGPAGTTGATGPQGPTGPAGTAIVDVTTQSAAALADLTVTGEITGVTINSPPVVNFKISDNNGRGVIGLTSSSLRFIIAKLVPGTNGDPDSWRSYINRQETPTAGVGTATAPTTQATTESNGTLVSHGDGSYTYTFATDLDTVTDPVTSAPIGYDASLTHRVAIQASGSGLPALNIVHDFVPAGGNVSTKRNIATVASCNECHGKLALHGGGRIEVEYCVTCHNPGTVDANSGNNLNLAVMAHKIHAGHQLPSVEAGGEYAIWGFRDSKHDYSEVTYPQDLANCRKCHNGADAATPQGDNWKNKPNMVACGACHDDVNFVDGTNHDGGAQASNVACATCHTPALIEEYHLTENATPNNPSVETGLVNFTYEISTATVASDRAVVTFRILSDGTPVAFGAPGTTLLTGFSGSPSFLVGYALPQGGVTAPTEYNNLGKSAGQPASVSISNLWDGTRGTLAGPDVDGYYTATIGGGSSNYLIADYPAGATLRAVALQGYFTQQDVPFDANGDGLVDTADDVARHTIAAIKPVTGDQARREVVDSTKCGACHEWFEGHGGNRVYDMKVCVFCHNPNLTSSGRAANPATLPQATIDALGNDPSTFPEDSNNFKDMIHGIHASAKRTYDYEFVRNRNGGLYYNWSEVTFPGILENCQTCHKSGTFAVDEIPAGALPTTVVTTDGDPATTVNTDRGTVPNAADVVVSPITSACYYCHDSDLAKTHMVQNGGFFGTRGAYAAAETCVLCHGPGRTADVAQMHDIK